MKKVSCSERCPYFSGVLIKGFHCIVEFCSHFGDTDTVFGTAKVPFWGVLIEGFHLFVEETDHSGHYISRGSLSDVTMY